MLTRCVRTMLLLCGLVFQHAMVAFGMNHDVKFMQRRLCRLVRLL
jgi:hypothetical protein